MKRLTLAYFGTPYFSAVFLEKLLSDKTLPVDVKLVVTQPDKPVGRKQVLTKSPVKIMAEKFKIEVINTKVSDLKSKVSQLDLAFLFAYGDIIPDNLLSAPKYGFLNTHPSLLPLYRGPGPIAYPLILGDKKTGVTLIQLDKEIDHGAIIAQEELDINPSDKRSDLEIKLTDLAIRMFKETISSSYGQGSALSLQTRKQNHSLATFTRQMTKDDGFIPFSILKASLNNDLSIKWEPNIMMEYYEKNQNVQKSKIYSLQSAVYNLFRGLSPWPGIWTKVMINNKELRLKITDLNLKNDKLIIKKVQLEGKKEVDFETFKRAYKIF